MTTEREVLLNCACHKARMAARTVTRTYDEALRPVGLRATQLSVLIAISVEEAISIKALADVMGMDRSTLTRNLRPLEKEGLIVLGDEGWRRSRALKVTAKGRSRISAAIPYWERAQNALRKHVGENHWMEIHKGLERLIAAA